MKTFKGISTALLVLSVLCLSGIAAAQDDTQATVVTDDIPPYDGPVGPGSPLYGLKLALEDMDESFTANETERVNRQMVHARLRLSEVRGSLELNQSDSAEEALNNYWLKMNLTNVTISRWNSNTTGLMHAQEQIVKHQLVLENLLAGHPNNTGLQRAYNNSLRLEEKFSEKTMVKFNKTIDRNNQAIMKAIRLGQKEQDRRDWPEVTATGQPTEQETEKEKNQNAKPEVTGQQHGKLDLSPSVTQVPQNEQEKNRNKNVDQPAVTTVLVTTPPQGSGQGAGNTPDDKGNAGGNSGGQGKGNSKK